MSFAELVKFINRALQRVTAFPGSADEAFPRTEEEFLRLCDLLSEKAEALKEDSPKPLGTRPTYEGPPYPGDLYKERRRAEEQEEYYDERLRAYREARKLYTRQLELWLTEAKKREVEARRAETVESMYRSVENVFKQQRVSADTQPPDSGATIK